MVGPGSLVSLQFNRRLHENEDIKLHTEDKEANPNHFNGAI